MEPIPKLLEYRNVIPDSMFMSKRGNQSHIYDETWQPIPCLCRNVGTDPMFMPECGNRSIQQTTIIITMYILTIIQQEVIHGIQLFNYPHLRLR